MKLTYWVCAHLTDNDCYSIVARTKREAEEKRAAEGEDRYEPAAKCVIVYKDGFDLMETVTGEGGGRSGWTV